MLPSRMLNRLNHETAVHHKQADGDRLSILESPGPVRYRAYLAGLYGFEAPLEAAFEMTPGLAVSISRPRAKSDRLVADLRALGLDANAISMLPKCPNLFAFRGEPEALGWMYVTERAALLDQTVRHHLAKRLPAQVAVAGSHLAGPAGGAAKRFRELGEILDRIAHVSDVAERVVDAAHDAFRLQHDWLAEQPLRRVG